MSKLDSYDALLFVGSKLVRMTTTYKNGAENLCLTFQDADGERRQLSIQAERGSDLFMTNRKIKVKSEPCCCDWATDGKIKVHQPDCPTNPMRPPKSR